MQITPIQIKMNKASISFTAAAENYLERVKSSFDGKILEGVHSLAIDLLDIWSQKWKSLYLYEEALLMRYTWLMIFIMA